MEWIKFSFATNITIKEYRDRLDTPNVDIPGEISRGYRALTSLYGITVEEFTQLMTDYEWKPSREDQHSFANNIRGILRSNIVKNWKDVLDKITFAETFGMYDFKKLKEIIDLRK